MNIIILLFPICVFPLMIVVIIFVTYLYKKTHYSITRKIKN
jgi:hypothetical protein